MSFKIDAAINEKAFIDSVNRGVQAYNRKFAGKSGTINLKINEKGFRQPLGRITGDLNMFDSALAASNARVIAFGASTAVIGGVSKAFRELAKTTVEVGKAFSDINRILQLSNKNFEEFGNQLFDISKKNATAFQDVAKGALEFARQGLKTEETLKRTADAMTLVRLTGINADKAVSSLTATVNAFDSAMVTTSSSLNKFVAVETKFAVGARDLVEAIGRVGSSARDAKVGFDELNAMVTSVQQTTGRGGAVIGNAMKTIFTRLQRQSTLEALESYNVAVKDVQGNTLPAIQILNNFAKSYAGLADSSQAYLREQVAGVFQANILSAILRDLNKQQSTYSQALQVSIGATNEADLATAKLNQSLSALMAQTTTEFQKLQQNIGKETFEPLARQILEPLKSAMEGLNNLIDGEGAGSEVANGILKGIKNVIGGPGLVAIGTVLFTVFKNTIGYMAQALPQLIGLTTETSKRATLEKFIEAALRNEADLSKAVAANEGNAAAQAKLLMDYAVTTAAAMEGQEESMIAMVNAMMKMPKSMPAVAAATGGTKKPRGASGFIPGMAGEINDIRRGVGGVSPTSRPVSIPNFAFGGGVRGTMIANTGEYIVPNYRNGGSAIFNPNMVSQYGMPAGAKPVRGSGGYVPNFVDVGKLRLEDFEGMKPADLKKDSALMSRFTQLTGRKNLSTGMKDALKAGYAKRSAQSQARRDTFISKEIAMLTPPAGYGSGGSAMHTFGAGNKIPGMKGKPFSVAFRKYTYNPKTASKVGKNITPIEEDIEKGIISATQRFAQSIDPPADDLSPAQMKTALNTAQGGAGAISAAAGAAFEVGISQALGLQAAAPEKGVKNLDVPRGFFTQQLKDLFSTGGKKVRATVTGGDFKVRDSEGTVKSMAEKIMSPAGDPGWRSWVSARSRSSRGYVPNFAALGDAVEREAAAGVPLGSIRVGRSNRLASPNNPVGLGVTNTRDEPRGLKDVVGAARGFIPNYVGGVDLGGTVGKTNKHLAALNNGFTRFQTIIDKVALKLSKKEITESQAMRATDRLGRAAGKTGSSLTTLQTRVKSTAASMSASTAAAGGATGLKGRLKESMKQGGGMGVGIGLAMGLPMLGGAAEQAFGEGDPTGQVTSGALTGAGTGASLGMIFGPWGAGIGAAVGALGGLTNAAIDAGKSVEQLKREAEEFGKETEKMTSAGQAYIQAQEDLLSATNVKDMESAQQAVIKNFEAIKGTKLEESFAAAGADVKALTAALKDYEEERDVGGAIKKAGAAAAAADDTKYTKMFGAFGGAVEDYFTETIVRQTRALKPGHSRAYVPASSTFKYSIEDKNLKALKKDYGDMFELLATELSEGQLEELSKLLRDETNSWGFDETAVAKLVIKYGDRISNEYKTDLEEFFQNLEDATSGKLFTVQDFSTVIERVNAFGKKQDAAVATTVKLTEIATRSFIDIKDAMQMVATGLAKAAKFAGSLTKARGALGGNVAGILRTQGNTLGAIDFERSQAQASLDLKRQSMDQKFVADNITKLLNAVKTAGGVAPGDTALKDLNEAADVFTKDVAQGFKLLEQFSGRNSAATTQLQKTIKDSKVLYEDQLRNINVDQAILNSKFDLEEQKAQNLIREQALQSELRTTLHERKMLMIEEKSNAAKEEIRLKARLADTRTFAGMTGAQALRERQGINQGLTALQISGARRDALSATVRGIGEAQIQKDTVDSNLLLISSQSSLTEAVDDLTVEMQKSVAIARLEADTSARIVESRVQQRALRNTIIKDPNSPIAKIAAAHEGGAEAYFKMMADAREGQIRGDAAKQMKALLASPGGGGGARVGAGRAVNLSQVRRSVVDFEMQRAQAGGTFDRLKQFKSIGEAQKEINRLIGQEESKGENANTKLLEKLRTIREELAARKATLSASEQELFLQQKLTQEREIYNEEVKRSFTKSMSEGFQEVFRDTDYIFGRLGKELPMAFRDGMVGALEEAMDRTEDLGDAMRGFAVDMLKMVRRSFLQYSMSNFTNLIGMGASPGFRTSGPGHLNVPDWFGGQKGGILKARNGMYISGSRTGDKNPALLEDGEYVLNRNAVKAMGGPVALNRLNFGMAPRFQDGGSMMLNESVRSPRMSGFFLASDNPELQEAREAARAAYEKKQQKKAEKKQLLTTFLTTLVSAGIAQGSKMFGPKDFTGGAFGEGTFTDPITGATGDNIISLPSNAKSLGRLGTSIGQTGGYFNRGFFNRDSVPTFMAGGEYVMNNRAVRKYGLGFMGRLNGGVIPTMQAGGGVGGASTPPLNTSTATNTNNISINVNLGGGSGGAQSGSGGTGNVNADQESNRDQATEAKDLSERIRGAVLEVISQEQRLGGSLRKARH